MADTFPAFARDAAHAPPSEIAYSFCTLVSRPALYAQMLESLVAAGFTTADCEYLYRDNTAGNAADGYRGLNHMIAEARGRYVVLCHQDLLAVDPRAQLDGCLAELDTIAPDWGVVGNAGYSADRKKRFRLTDRHRYDDLLGPLPAQVVSLDENFLLIRRDALLGFSHDLSGFHLYGSDLVQQAALRGRSAWVVDFHLEHLGRGTVDHSFEACLTAFAGKYRRALRPRKIRTTVTTVGVGRQDLESRYRLYRLRKKITGTKPLAALRPFGKWLEALPHNLWEWRHGPNYPLDGTTFRLPPRSPLLARKAIRRGLYEGPERRMVARWLPRDLPVIELGGSYGIVSHAIRRHIAPETDLTIVEANPALLQICRANVGLAGAAQRTEVIGAALAYGAETVRFAVTDTLHTSHVAKAGDSGSGLVEVPAVSLAGLVARKGIAGDFSLVCDIEGAEFDLLQNDAAALARCAVIVMEIHPDAFMDRGETVSAFRRMLEGGGFDIVDHEAQVIVARRR